MPIYIRWIVYAVANQQRHIVGTDVAGTARTAIAHVRAQLSLLTRAQYTQWQATACHQEEARPYHR